MASQSPIGKVAAPIAVAAAVALAVPTAVAAPGVERPRALCTPVGTPVILSAAADRLVTTVPHCASSVGLTSYIAEVFRGADEVPTKAVAVDLATTKVEVTGLAPGVVFRSAVVARAGGNLGFNAPRSAPAPLPFSTTDKFAVRQYLDFAGRQPTAAEKAALLSKFFSYYFTPVTAIDELQAAPYWQVQSPIVRLFQAYFLRLPDLGGLNYWVDRSRHGLTLRAISQTFAESPEFIARYGSLTNRGFVELVYQNVLGRPGETSGVDYWTAQLTAGHKTRGQVMLGFSESTEYSRQTTGQVTVVNLFTGMLRRVPTAAETITWKATSPPTLIRFLLGSSAYTSRPGVG
ncbi:MAG: hypothetical protein JWM05_2272 [Acidimicrobiales bacterium]|nr:hypothetical protein [Acidimicrobiales bacterium]